jgi:hypothetical protein
VLVVCLYLYYIRSMRKPLILALVLFSFSACSDNTTVTDPAVETMPDGKKIPDFLAMIRGEDVEGGRGYLGGVNHTDSSGPYVSFESYNDTLSFELIFYPKKLPRDSVQSETVNNDAANGYPNFICFAFVYPIPNPYKAADYHADNTPYPVTVKVFVRKNKTWKYLSQSKVGDLKALREYQISSMYSVIK